MTTQKSPSKIDINDEGSLTNCAIALAQFVGMPATGLALGVGSWVGLFHTAMISQPYVNLPVAVSELTALNGPVAVAAMAGIGFGVLANLSSQHVKEAGDAIKSFGQDMLSKTAQLGQALGLLKPGESATQKVIENADEPGANWKKMAAHSTLLMMAPVAISSTFMTLGTGMEALHNAAYAPYAIGAAATVAASAFAIYKSIKATSGMEHGGLGETLEQMNKPKPRKAEPKPESSTPSLG